MHAAFGPGGGGVRGFGRTPHLVVKMCESCEARRHHESRSARSNTSEDSWKGYGYLVTAAEAASPESCRYLQGRVRKQRFSGEHMLSTTATDSGCYSETMSLLGLRCRFCYQSQFRYTPVAAPDLARRVLLVSFFGIRVLRLGDRRGRSCRPRKHGTVCSTSTAAIVSGARLEAQ